MCKLSRILCSSTGPKSLYVQSSITPVNELSKSWSCLNIDVGVEFAFDLNVVEFDFDMNVDVIE